MRKKRKGIKVFIKKEKKQILSILVSLFFFYLLLISLPLSVKNVLFLTYKQSEITKAGRQKYQLFGELNGPYISSGRDTDVYGKKIVILPGTNKDEEPAVSSSGADNKFNTPDDVDIKKVVKETIKNIIEDYPLRLHWNIADNHLYSVMYKFWQEYPLATVEIPNSPSVKNIKISLSLGDYGRKILENCEKLGTSIIKVMPEFTVEKLSELTSPQEVTCSIKMEYEIYGTKKSTETFHKLIIHPLNDFTWNDPEILSCFITPSDEMVSTISLTAVNMFTAPAVNSNLGKTGILFYTSKSLLEDKKVDEQKNQCFFPRQCLFENKISPVTLPVFFSSMVMSQGIDINLAVLSDKKLVLVMVNAEKIKVRSEKGSLPEALVDKVTYLLPNVLGSHKFLKEKLCPQKETFSGKLYHCYVNYNGQEYLVMNLLQNSFLDACKSSVDFKKYLIDRKLTIVDIEKARKLGYLPPDKIEQIFPVRPVKAFSMKQIENKGGDELEEILNSEVIYE